MRRQRKTYTTREVADRVGVSMRSMYRWLYAGELQEPEIISIASNRLRLWTTADIARVRQFIKARPTLPYASFRQFLSQWPEIRDELRHLPRERKPMAMDSRRFVGVFGRHEDILSRDQLASRLKLKPGVLYDLTRGRGAVRVRIQCEKAGVPDIGPLPHVKVGREILFNWPDVSAWLDQKQAVERKLQEQRAAALLAERGGKR